ncbi:MAG: hypothetical protein JO092_06975 [Candidatus Eremiobacteraeota bacterium]|nr:hypothetical protein [Candidatus Eremiobacteraeota bacterium]
MIMLFGMMQIGLMTYYQTSADAAVFFTAHEYSIYANPTNINNSLNSTFPGVVANNVVTNPAQPPNVNDTLFQNIYACNDESSCPNARYSGYEVVRPQGLQAQIQQNGNAVFHGIFGFNNLPLSAGAVEPLYLITNTVWDNTGAGANGNLGSGYLNEGAASPFLSGGAANNMNVPPYYTYASVDQFFCSDPWSSFRGYANSDACTNPSYWFLGLGEYLNNANYSANTVGLGANPGQVFQAMACHQRVYADLVQAFPVIANPTGAATQSFQTTFQGATGNSTAVENTAAPAPWSVPMAYYDEMAMYAQGVSSLGGSSGFNITRTYFNDSRGNPDAIVAHDSNGAAKGPYQWSSTPAVTGSNGASFALVFQWDQPSDYDSLAQGFFNPLVGCTSPGQPGY